MTVLSLVEAAAPRRLLVTGSLPPEGRDLDLLAPPGPYAAVADALEHAGFIRRHTTWARFEPLELVDLRRLPDESMLSRATPLPGFDRLCRPHAADDVRLVATAFAQDGQLTAGRRRRADVSTSIWQQAHAWGDSTAVSRLRQALAGEHRDHSTLARVVGRARRVQQARVIALSGVDGAGKSTQAIRLRDTLTTAGVDTAVEWNRISHEAWLDRLARPVKKLLGTSTSAPGERVGGSGQRAPGQARSLWVVVVALANALSHRRSVRRHLLAGRTVICDRYVLDSVVQLTADYPDGPGRRLGIALVRALSPRPAVSFHLRVPTEVAAARKPYPGPVAQLERHARGYDDTLTQLGVLEVDAHRPVDDVAAELARETWRRL